jgi:hypothetical protein
LHGPPIQDDAGPVVHQRVECPAGPSEDQRTQEVEAPEIQTYESLAEAINTSAEVQARDLRRRGKQREMVHERYRREGM